MTIGKGKGQMARYNQILELFLVIFFSIGIIDEFYLNGKLVAFQYAGSLIIRILPFNGIVPEARD